VICEYCGFILKPDEITTRKIDTRRLPYIEPALPKTADQPITLLVEGYESAPIHFQVHGPVILGRQGDLMNDTMGFVNFDAYEAHEKGVSRRHAMLTWIDEQLMICDLGSSNHTYINGLRLAKNRDYPLRNGDEISLAGLTFKVTFG
jgi:hypothetical protein